MTTQVFRRYLTPAEQKQLLTPMKDSASWVSRRDYHATCLMLCTGARVGALVRLTVRDAQRSEEHTSELQSLMRISYAVFCLKKKTHNTTLPETVNNKSYLHTQIMPTMTHNTHTNTLHTHTNT